jgi:hypothetical protein
VYVYVYVCVCVKGWIVIYSFTTHSSLYEADQLI